MRPNPYDWRRVVVAFLLERDGLHCPLCGGILLEGVEIDHVLPVVEGGPTIPTNLRLVHAACNKGRCRVRSERIRDWAPTRKKGPPYRTASR